MDNKLEVNKAFKPADKINTVQMNKIRQVEQNFLDLATELVDLLPPGSKRDTMMAALLVLKFRAVHAISHPDEVTPDLKGASMDEIKAHIEELQTESMEQLKQTVAQPDENFIEKIVQTVLSKLRGTNEENSNEEKNPETQVESQASNKASKKS